MDLQVLKRKISTYRTEGGYLKGVSDELLGEILHAWEQWTGPASNFYRELGVDYRKMGSLMGKAKKLKREGAFDGLQFTEVVVEDENGVASTSAQVSTGCGIELVWDNNKIIRFGSSELLVDFLKKAA